MFVVCIILGRLYELHVRPTNRPNVQSHHLPLGNAGAPAGSENSSDRRPLGCFANKSRFLIVSLGSRLFFEVKGCPVLRGQG